MISLFKNHLSCKAFVHFAQHTFRLRTGQAERDGTRSLYSQYTLLHWQSCANEKSTESADQRTVRSSITYQNQIKYLLTIDKLTHSIDSSAREVRDHSTLACGFCVLPWCMHVTSMERQLISEETTNNLHSTTITTAEAAAQTVVLAQKVQALKNMRTGV